MRAFRYDTAGRWFKGGIHGHSTASDGGLTFAELAELYAGAGYDFLFRTDHWVASDAASDGARYPLLWLDGIELDGSDSTGAAFHVVCLGRVRDVDRAMGFENALRAARAQGALLVLAHPQWCGNREADALRWRFDGVEVYNHVCRWLNGKSDGTAYWNLMLRQRPDTLAFAVDDAHLRGENTGWAGGWTMVNAPRGTPAGLLEALRAGNFYSSCGPEIRSLAVEDGVLRVETSPVQCLRLVGPEWLGWRRGSFGGTPFTETTLELPQEWRYVYLEVEDAQGRRAWTNSLFVD